MEALTVRSSAFENNGAIPTRHTGFGIDLSPELTLSPLSKDVQSLVILMDDLDIPVMGEMNHWVIWNLPATTVIPEGLPAGAHITQPFSAVQGIGYGKHQYRGPKQPPFIRKAHRYRFTVYALDCILKLSADSRKQDLLRAINTHILQTGVLIGHYKP